MGFDLGLTNYGSKVDRGQSMAPKVLANSMIMSKLENVGKG